MPAFEAEVGMPYWIDLTTADTRKSARFYEEVLGIFLSLLYQSAVSLAIFVIFAIFKQKNNLQNQQVKK